HRRSGSLFHERRHEGIREPSEDNRESARCARSQQRSAQSLRTFAMKKKFSTGCAGECRSTVDKPRAIFTKRCAPRVSLQNTNERGFAEHATKSFGRIQTARWFVALIDRERNVLLPTAGHQSQAVTQQRPPDTAPARCSRKAEVHELHR